MRILSTLFAAMIAVVSTSALAGVRIPSGGGAGVTIINGNQAISSIGGTRNSASPDELILILDRGSSILVSATDEMQNQLFCNTTNPVHMAVLRGLTGDSVVDFQVDAYGVCTIVKSTKGSHLQPKLPF